MLVILYRKRTNGIYTEGELHINGSLQAYTVEDTQTMLRTGRFELRLVCRSQRKRRLMVYKDGRSLGVAVGKGHSWICSRRYRTICIGRPLIPGALFRCTADCERINERLKKCKARHEVIELVIHDYACVKNEPISFWQE